MGKDRDLEKAFKITNEALKNNVVLEKLSRPP